MSRIEQLEYIADHLRDLHAMAQREKAELLAYLIDMAKIEAAEQMRAAKPAKEPAMHGSPGNQPISSAG